MFNRLSAAEHERLALLAEECAETIQVIGKILRHGYESCHPNGGPSNRDLLHRELGDVQCAARLLIEAGDVHEGEIARASTQKRMRVGRYLHHQEGPASAE